MRARDPIRGTVLYMETSVLVWRRRICDFGGVLGLVEVGRSSV